MRVRTAFDVTSAPSPPKSRRVDEPVDVAELVARAAVGDPDAAETLVARFRPAVYRYCRARLGGTPGADQSADDAAQEVCLAVLHALPRYRDEGRPFEAFVFGVAAHKVADAQRAAARSAQLHGELQDRQQNRYFSRSGRQMVRFSSFPIERVGGISMQNGKVRSPSFLKSMQKSGFSTDSSLTS